MTETEAVFEIMQHVDLELNRRKQTIMATCPKCHNRLKGSLSGIMDHVTACIEGGSGGMGMGEGPDNHL